MFAIVWLIALPMSFAAPFCGLLLWIWVALLSPNELLYGFMAGVPLNKLVALTTLPLLILGKEKKDFYLDGPLILLLLLGITATFSWIFAILPTDDGTELYLKLIKIIVLVLASSAIMRTRSRIHAIVWAIVIALTFLSVKEGLIFLLTAGGHQIIGSGSIGDNNSLAAALLMIIPLAYYLILYSELKIIRVVLAGTILLTVITIIATFSRGGFLGLIVLAIFMISKSKNKLISFFIVAMAGLLIFGFAPEAWFNRLNTIESANSDDSFLGRVVAWKISLLIAMDHPLVGGGPHAVQRYFVWNNYRPFLYKVDFLSTPIGDISPKAAHSIYFEALGDMGFTGLILFVSLLVFSAWRCRTIVKLGRGVPALRWAVDLAQMMQISIVVFAITAALLSMVYFELLYIIVAMISRSHRCVLQHLATTAGEQSVTPKPHRSGQFIPGPLALPSASTRVSQRH